MRCVGDELSHPADGQVPDEICPSLVEHRHPLWGRKAIRASTRTFGSCTGVSENAVQTSCSLHRSPGGGCLPIRSSASVASCYSHTARQPVSPDRYGDRMFLSTRCADTSPRSATASSTRRVPRKLGAALRARRGPHQRVIMAIHFAISQADRYAESREIKRDDRVFRAIRQFERETIPQVDGIVYVSSWARNALLDWLPEAEAVPSAVIGNFVAPLGPRARPEPLGDLGEHGQARVCEEPPFHTRRTGRSQAGRACPHPRSVRRGTVRERTWERQARDLWAWRRQARFRGFRPGVREFLPAYRAYVRPASYCESSSLAIIEAMAAGLPIVAGDIGPISELCDDGAEARFWAIWTTRPGRRPC